MPRCESCSLRHDCEARGALREEYPACRAPLRNVDLLRTSTLLDWLARRAGAVDDATRALQAPLLARYAEDCGERPDVLEPSFSCDPTGAHVYRFSYGFPTLRRQRAEVERTVLTLSAPLGAHVVAAARTVLRAARSPAVEQVLFGYAHGEGGATARPKLYLQFLPGAPAGALALAGRMLGTPLDSLERLGPLHLLCLDVGSAGLSAAKLYFSIDRIAVDDVPSRIGPVPLVAALEELGVAELRHLLAIHRLRGPDDAAAARAVEVDFSLEDNDLRWLDVRALPLVRAQLERSQTLGELQTSFRLAVRRISGSVGDGSKLNVYYGLNEAPLVHRLAGALKVSCDAGALAPARVGFANDAGGTIELGALACPPPTLWVGGLPLPRRSANDLRTQVAERRERLQAPPHRRRRACEGVRRTAWRGRLAAKQRGGAPAPHETNRSASSGSARRGPNLVHRRRRDLKRNSKTVY